MPEKALATTLLSLISTRSKTNDTPFGILLLIEDTYKHQVLITHFCSSFGVKRSQNICFSVS